MPYIVTTKRAVVTTVPEGEGHSQVEAYRRLTGAPLVQDMRVETFRRAVATLDEARVITSGVFQQAIGYRKDAGTEENRRRTREDIERCGNWAVPESGGTIGPLPDGTVIEVERIGRVALYRELPTIVQARFGHAANVRADEIVGAFNAAQEAS